MGYTLKTFREIPLVIDFGWHDMYFFLADLKRILVSFLCIAAPVQIFGVIIVISGWVIRRDFDIYAGGIVLVMSGIDISSLMISL